MYGRRHENTATLASRKNHLPSTPAAPAELLRVKLKPFEEFRQSLEAPLGHEVSLGRDLHHGLPNAAGYAPGHRNDIADKEGVNVSAVS